MKYKRLTIDEEEMIFDSLSKAIRGQAQRCNMCGQMSPMKNTNVCEKCKKRGN